MAKKLRHSRNCGDRSEYFNLSQPKLNTDVSTEWKGKKKILVTERRCSRRVCSVQCDSRGWKNLRLNPRTNLKVCTARAGVTIRGQSRIAESTSVYRFSREVSTRTERNAQRECTLLSRMARARQRRKRSESGHVNVWDLYLYWWCLAIVVRVSKRPWKLAGTFTIARDHFGPGAWTSSSSSASSTSCCVFIRSRRSESQHGARDFNFYPLFPSAYFRTILKNTHRRNTQIYLSQRAVSHSLESSFSTNVSKNVLHTVLE